MIVTLFRVVKSRNNLHHEGRVDLLRVVVGQKVMKKHMVGKIRGFVAYTSLFNYALCVVWSMVLRLRPFTRIIHTLYPKMASRAVLSSSLKAVAKVVSFNWNLTY